MIVKKEKISLSNVIDKCGLFIDGDWIESKDQDPKGEIRIIQLADIGDGIFLNKSNRFLTREKAHKLRCTFLKKGDLLIARMPEPLGRACIFPGDEKECVTVVDVCIVRPNSRDISNEYLKYLVNCDSFRKKIAAYSTGTTRKRISRSNLDKIRFDLPEFEDQIHIATVLSHAEALIAKRKESIKALDDLLKSTFLEMFGDPVKNEKGWDKKALKDFGKITTGNTPPRNDDENYFSNIIEWIKTDNIVENRTYLTEAAEYLSEKGLAKSRTVKSGALLVACIAGSIESIGRAAIANREVSFNQQINAIQTNEKINPLFLYWLFKISRNYIQNYATKGMKKIITKGVFENITMIRPPLSLQDKFAAIAENVEAIKAKYQESLTELENLYGSLSQQAFNGELDLSRIPVDVQVEAQTSELVIETPDPEIETSRGFKIDEIERILKGKAGQKFSFEGFLKNELRGSILDLDHSTDELPEYNKVKNMIFELLNRKNPYFFQEFDKDKREMLLRVEI